MRVVSAAFLGITAAILSLPSHPAPLFAGSEAVVTVLKERGGRVDWSRSGNNMIAFDKKGADGYYDVYVMRADGSGEQCLTCDTGGRLPARNNGNPAWHPSGAYIVFQSEKQEVPKKFDPKTEPGAGILNDLWVMSADGQRFVKLLDVQYRLQDAPGTLHPQFSPDGTKLFWAERLGAGTITNPRSLYGKWVLKIANFVETAEGPHLEYIRSFHPGDQWDFYESHAFSPDGSKILFCGNLEDGQPGWGLDIYELELATGALKNLTNTKYIWDEHAHYSPDGKKIVWMSSKGYNLKQGLRTEFWLMDADGSHQQQLTFFNQSGHPHQQLLGRSVKHAVAADCSFSPDGAHIIGRVGTNNPDTEGSIVLIALQ
jgi:Tol biopolymer transport system component